MSKKKKAPLKSQATCTKKTCGNKKCSNKTTPQSPPSVLSTLWNRLKKMVGK